MTAKYRDTAPMMMVVPPKGFLYYYGLIKRTFSGLDIYVLCADYVYKGKE